MSYILDQTTVFVLTNPQVARICWVLLAHWDTQDKSQSLSSSSTSWCICHVAQLSLPAQGEAESWSFSCLHFVLSQEEGLCRVPAQTTILVSFWCLEDLRSQKCHMTSKTEASPLGSSWKSWSNGLQSNSFLLQWEARSSSVSFWSYGTIPEVGILARRCLEFPYWFQCVWFHTCPKCRSLSTSFWMSHQGNFSLNCCWISMFMGERESKASYLFCHLADIILQEPTSS